MLSVAGQLVVLLLVFLVVDAQFNFHRPRFPTSGLFVLPSLNITGEFLVAFADVNSDSFTDLITYNPAKNTLQFYLWARPNFGFHRAEDSVSVASPTAGLVNAIASDFDYDGHLDLLLQFPSSASILYGPEFGLGDTMMGVNGQLAIVDVDGNRAVDLLDAKNVWKPSEFGSRKYQQFPAFPSCVPHHDIAMSYVDIDGDCSADVFVVCQDLSYEIFVNLNSGGQYSKHSSGSLPAGTKAVQFIDMNADGTSDALVTICDTTSCRLQISYNKQVALCSSTGQTLCRASSRLCSADPTFSLSFEHKDSTSLRISTITNGYAGNLATSNSYSFHPPRLGDINLDAYADALVILQIGQQRIAHLLRNIKCSVLPNQLASDDNCVERALVSWGDESDVVLKSFDAVQQAFLTDMDERGAFDILLVNGKTTESMQFVSIFNNYYNDAFFLKLYASNGVCYKDCSGAKSDIKPLGTNYPGATFKYTVLDPSGNKRFAVGNQLSQSTHGSCHSPFNLVGLGRTNNYIEEFFAGFSGVPSEGIFSWTGLIPNSQLLIHPPTSPDSPSRHEGWLLELFISPGGYALYVLIACIVCVVVLTVIVAGLRLVERREDEEERRRALHIINFDAL